MVPVKEKEKEESEAGVKAEDYWRSIRYSLALLSSLKKSEASVVVRPVKVVSFLSG